MARTIAAAGVCGVVAACSISSLTTPLAESARINPQPAILPTALSRPPLYPPSSVEPPEVATGAAVPLLAEPAVAEAQPSPAPPARGRYQVGKPYEIAGKWYEPREDREYDQAGMASWYGMSFHGRMTANGETFDSAAISAAHPTLPLPSYVRVTNLENDRSIVVRVNDRGPYAHDRLIDVSEQAAELLGFRRHGLTHVRVQYISEAPLDAEDKSVLLASYRGSGEEALGSGVMLASATPPPVGQTAPAAPVEQAVPIAPIAPAVAFVADESGADGADAAMETLTGETSAAARILLAFEVADEVEE